MLSDAEKKLVTHASEVLRALAGAVEYESTQAVAATIADAKDTADKLDEAVTPKPSKSCAYEVGSGSRDLDETKLQGLAKHTARIAADETELGQ